MPLPTLEVVWNDISTDFISILLMVRGKSIIKIEVERLTKFYDLGALPVDFTSKMKATFL